MKRVIAFLSPAHVSSTTSDCEPASDKSLLSLPFPPSFIFFMFYIIARFIVIGRNGYSLKMRIFIENSKDLRLCFILFGDT